MTMRLEISRPEPTRGYRIVEIFFNLFLRIVALVFLALSLQIWAQAIGLWPDTSLRFDTMTNAQRIYTAVLAVLHPVTAVGLWTTMSWARAVWFLTIGFQTIIIMQFVVALGLGGWIIIFHAVTLLIYLIFQLALGFMRKEA